MRRLLARIKVRLRPKITRVRKITGTQFPRQQVAVNMQSTPVVIKTAAASPLAAWKQLRQPWDTALSQVFQPGQQVLVKVNLNTADPYPASTDPAFLSAFLQFLHTQGITNILVGDCASLSALPTRRVARQTGLLSAIDGLAQMVYFDEMDWLEVPVAGLQLSKVTIPATVFEVDRIISLSNLKTHFLAGYTMAMKSAVGFMHPAERHGLHREHLHQKLVEISLAVMPDLNVVDGRTAFISGGPAKGQTAAADVVILGTHPASVDMEAYLELYRLKEKHGCLEAFLPNPLDMPQLKHATQLWPDPGWQDYRLLMG